MKNTFWDGDKVMSIAAMFISLGTLTVLIYQARMATEQQELYRKQQMMSVYPYLSMFNNGTGSKDYRLTIKNTGIGPAILKSVKVYAKGNTYDDIVFFLDDTFSEADSISYGHSNLWEGRMIPQGETVYPITVTDNKVSSGLKVVEAIFGLYTYVEIIYESVYGETWMLSNRNSSPIKLCDTCRIDPQTVGYRSEFVEVIPVSDHSYLHISYLETDNRGVEGYNGYIHVDNGEAIVFDSPTSKEGAQELIQWIENSLDAKVKALVTSDLRGEGLGGLEVFHEADINSYIHVSALSLVKEQGGTFPMKDFERQQVLQIGETEVISSFLGEGLTQGNIVSFIATDQVLLGGALVQSPREEKRDWEGANIDEWPKTLRRIQEEFSETETIIPSQGFPGGGELLEYTLGLFEPEKLAQFSANSGSGKK